MKDLKAVRGSYYIARLIAEGEHETQDFKFAISDARKIARSLSAFANHRGGHLLVGVKDNGVIAGVRNEEDIYVIEQAAEMYCDPPQALEFTSFVTDGGAIVIRAAIAAATSRPVRASEPDGRWRAYVRVADENIVASPLMVRGWMMASSGRPLSLTFGDSERLLLTMLQQDEGLTVEQYMRAAGISRRRAEEIIVALHSAGALAWRHSPSGWLLVTPTQGR